MTALEAPSLDTAPTVREPDDYDDDVIHIVPTGQDLSLCGLDLTDGVWVDLNATTEDVCIACDAVAAVFGGREKFA